MRGRCAGAAMVELQLVALLVMLPLSLGVVQVGLLVAGYNLLGFAAAEAARAGAVDHASEGAMRSGLAEGLLPLVVDLTRVEAGGGPLGLVAEGRARAMLEVLQFARIERLAPVAADFSDHAIPRDGRRVIPNDALDHRPAAPGRSGGRSVQAANLLRLRVRYCHALVVPLIDRLLPELLLRLDPDPDALPCYAAGRVPLRVESSMPMQSDAWP